MPAFFSASSAKGFTRPLGALPALYARTSLPSLRARWFSMPSLSTLRAELCVQRISTLVVVVMARSSGRSSALADALQLLLPREGVELVQRQRLHQVDPTLQDHQRLDEDAQHFVVTSFKCC